MNDKHQSHLTEVIKRTVTLANLDRIKTSGFPQSLFDFLQRTLFKPLSDLNPCKADDLIVLNTRIAVSADLRHKLGRRSRRSWSLRYKNGCPYDGEECGIHSPPEFSHFLS